MKKRHILIIAIAFILMSWLYFSVNYKISKVEIITNKNIKVTESFLLPNYAELHLYNCRLQYTKNNNWHQSIYYNVKSFKAIK
jgi:hypothetical protein